MNNLFSEIKEGDSILEYSHFVRELFMKLTSTYNASILENMGFHIEEKREPDNSNNSGVDNFKLNQPRWIVSATNKKYLLILEGKINPRGNDGGIPYEISVKENNLPEESLRELCQIRSNFK
ncbi:hypothetical protein K2X92_03935 [Candidatus Gracilibacteria bacterium]|nr:hypothetical protein [Candidatus Gracilibacteria bacterium]